MKISKRWIWCFVSVVNKCSNRIQTHSSDFGNDSWNKGNKWLNQWTYSQLHCWLHNIRYMCCVSSNTDYCCRIAPLYSDTIFKATVAIFLSIPAHWKYVSLPTFQQNKTKMYLYLRFVVVSSWKSTRGQQLLFLFTQCMIYRARVFTKKA